MPANLKSLLPILLIILVLIAAGFWIYLRFFDTYHLATIRDRVLYRDGVRNLHQFELAVQKTHVKTIVSLVDDSEIGQPPFTDELAYCKASGIDVVRIPILLGGWPSADQVQQFLAITTDPARQPVLVHCAQGVRRTGMMVAAYQRSVLNMDAAQTRDAILTFGHSQRTVGDVQKFIEIYDPAEKKMTQEMQRSSE